MGVTYPRDSAPAPKPGEANGFTLRSARGAAAAHSTVP